MALAPRPDGSPNYALMGFLAAAIAVLGMLGVMATYIAPLPLERAMARDAALDQAQAALAGPDPQQALEALRVKLGESAEAVLPKGGQVGPETAARIEAERTAMHARMLAESQGTGARLRVMMLVCSLMTMGFGALAIHASRKR